MYRALTRERFLLPEFMVVCKLKANKLTDKEIMQKLHEENLFQFESSNSIETIGRTLVRRLAVLNERPLLLDFAITGTHNHFKLVNLYCMMKSNQLIEDLYLKLIYEKIHFNEELNRGDIITFMYNIADQVPNVASWSSQTVQRTISEIIKILVDTNIVLSSELGHVAKIYAPNEFIDLLKSYGDHDYLRVYGE